LDLGPGKLDVTAPAAAGGVLRGKRQRQYRKNHEPGQRDDRSCAKGDHSVTHTEGWLLRPELQAEGDRDHVDVLTVENVVVPRVQEKRGGPLLVHVEVDARATVHSEGIAGVLRSVQFQLMEVTPDSSSEGDAECGLGSRVGWEADEQ